MRAESEVVSILEVVVDRVEGGAVHEGVHEVVVEIEVANVADDALIHAGTRGISLIPALFDSKPEELEAF